MRTRRHLIVSLSVVSTVLLTAGRAFAAIAAKPLPPPPPTDLSMRVLTAIFGPEAIRAANGLLMQTSSAIVPHGALTAQGLLGSMFGVLNTGLLAAAAVVAVVGVTNGIIHTAQTGTWGGKVYSTFWGPLRSVVSLAALAPVVNGYSFAQIVVLALAVEGVALANGVNTAAVHSLTAAGGDTLYSSLVVVPAPPPMAIKRTAREIMDDATCAATANLEVSPLVHGTYIYRWDSGSQGTTETISWGPKSDNDLCGSVHILLAATTAGHIASDLGLGMTQAVDARNALLKAQRTATITMIATLKPYAAQVAAAAMQGHTYTPPPDLLSRVSSAYVSALKTSLMSIAAKAQPSTDGWLSAGALYYASANVARAANSAMSELPVVYTPHLGPASAGYMLSVGGGMGHLQLPITTAAVSAVDSWAGSDGAPGVVSSALHTMGEWVGGAWDVAKRLVHPERAANDVVTAASASHMLTTGVTKWISSDLTSGDPLGTIVSWGTTIVDIALTGGVLAVIATAGLGLPLAFGLLLAGLSLCVVVPLMPALIFTLAAIGWLVSTLELVCIIPFILVINASPAGEGWSTDKVRAEMLGVLNVLARPALIVVGLYASLLVLKCGCWLAGKLLGPQVLAALASQSTQGLVIATALMIVLAGILIALTYKSVTLITSVPDYLMRLLGGAARPVDPMGGWQKIEAVMGGAGALLAGQAAGTAEKALSAPKTGKPSGPKGGGSAGSSAASGSDTPLPVAETSGAAAAALDAVGTVDSSSAIDSLVATAPMPAPARTGRVSTAGITRRVSSGPRTQRVSAGGGRTTAMPAGNTRPRAAGGGVTRTRPAAVGSSASLASATRSTPRPSVAPATPIAPAPAPSVESFRSAIARANEAEASGDMAAAEAAKRQAAEIGRALSGGGDI